MPSINVVDMTGKKVSTIDLADSIFAIEPNTAVMHQMVVSYLANQRQGTQSALTRSEVSGGGKKPWRQKGTGRARQGSTRAPQWTHGGVVFAPKPRSYSFSVNKKVKRLAMKSALSSKVIDNDLIVAAICAAPSILGHAGYLKGRKATCFPGFEDDLHGADMSDESFVWDGNILTAKGAGVALDFAFELVKHLVSEEKSAEIRGAIQCR